jgi:hypothetical protein
MNIFCRTLLRQAQTLFHLLYNTDGSTARLYIFWLVGASRFRTGDHDGRTWELLLSVLSCPTALALIRIEWEAVWAREPVWKLCWWRKHLISPRNRSPVLQPLAVDFTDEANPAHESSQLVPDVQRSPPPLSTLHTSWNIADEDDTFLRCVEKHWIWRRSITSLNIRILKIVTILWFIGRILFTHPSPPSLHCCSHTKIPYSFFDWYIYIWRILRLYIRTRCNISLIWGHYFIRQLSLVTCCLSSYLIKASSTSTCNEKHTIYCVWSLQQYCV